MQNIVKGGLSFEFACLSAPVARRRAPGVRRRACQAECLCLWNVCVSVAGFRSLSLVLDKVVADFVDDFKSVLASQSKYNYNTSLAQQIFLQVSAACYWQTSQYIITVCRIPDNYGVIWCAQVRFSIIRAKSAKAFDSCPASRQLYKALLWPQASWQFHTIPAKGCGEKHSNLEHGKMVGVGARHPHWWHPLVPPWGGQWTVATGCQQFRRQWGHLGAAQGSLDSIQTTTAKSCKKKHFTEANCTSSCQEVWLDLGQKHGVQQFQSFPPNGQTMRRIFQLTGGNCAAKTSARWQNMLPGISTTRLTWDRLVMFSPFLGFRCEISCKYVLNCLNLHDSQASRGLYQVYAAMPLITSARMSSSHLK